MKLLLLSGVTLLTCGHLLAQQNVVSSGGDASGTNGSVSYSIGQLDYSNAQSANGSTNEGVQQPFEFFNPEASLEVLQWDVQLFPNPTNDQVVLQFENPIAGTKYQLIDATGRILQEGVILASSTLIDMRSYAPAIYQLRLSQATVATTIQIIKN